MRALVRQALSLTAAGAVVCLAGAVARADTAPEVLKEAHDAFEYGDFPKTVSLLKSVPAEQDLSESQRVQAYRMLGLAYFYLHRPADAENAMFELLKQDPDYQLDPFFVPPDAVAFFDQVRRRNEKYLAPIRKLRHERLKAEAEEAKMQALAEEQRRTALTKPRVLEETVAHSSVLLAWMPFGLGQFQNGSVKLGATFAATEVLAAVVSIGSYLLVDALRSSQTHRFSPPNYALAQKLDTAKWASGGAFYLLWLAGAVEANVDFAPDRVLSESELPSAAPAGPLPRPVSVPAATAPPAPAQRPSVPGAASSPPGGQARPMTPAAPGRVESTQTSPASAAGGAAAGQRPPVANGKAGAKGEKKAPPPAASGARHPKAVPVGDTTAGQAKP